MKKPNSSKFINVEEIMLEETEEEVVQYKEPFKVNDKTPMKFGKYLGKSHIEVFESNRKYCDWVISQGEKFYWSSSQEYFRNKIHEHKNINNISFIDFLNLLDKKNKTEEETIFLEECQAKLQKHK